MISTANHLELPNIRCQSFSESLVSINIALVELVNKFTFIQEQNLAYLNSLSIDGAQKFYNKLNEDPEVQKRIESYKAAKASNALNPYLPHIQLKKIKSTPSMAKNINHSEESLFKKRRLNSGKELLKLESISESTSETEFSDILSQFTSKSRESPRTTKQSTNIIKQSFKLVRSTKSESISDRSSNTVCSVSEGLGPFKFFKKSTDYKTL